MTQPALPDELRTRLSVIEGQLIGEATTAGGQANRAALEALQADLQAELIDLEQPVLDLVIDGPQVLDHRARVGPLADLLSSLQGSLSAIAQSLTGKATPTGALPADIVQSTGLFFEMAFQGSFGARLRAPAETVEQPPLAGTLDTERLLDRAVGTFLDVVSLSAQDGPDDDDLMGAVLPLGPRSYSHLRALAQTVTSDAIEARVAWRPGQGNERSVAITRPAARRLEAVLTEMTTNTERVVILGHLGTVSDWRQYFELLADDGETIRGVVDDEVVPQLAEFFTQRVTATLDVTVGTSRATGRERRSYVLRGLATSDTGAIELNLDAGEDDPPRTM